ncbi:MAG: hypothetical protein ABI467_27420 [Kofleriaceae bacterium]
MKCDRAVGRGDECAVGEERMRVAIEVEQRTEALHERDRATVRIDRLFARPVMLDGRPSGATPLVQSVAEFGPSRSPKPAGGDHRNRRMTITETGDGDRRNRASRSPKPVMAIA